MDKTIDKNYVKKYKINELLNDLYLALTREKPDDPVNYAITHFEAKRPTQNEKKTIVPSEDQAAQLTGLLKKGNLESLLKKSTDNEAVGDSAALKMQNLFGDPGKKGLGQLKIMSAPGCTFKPFNHGDNKIYKEKLHHVVSAKCALTEEDILKNEEITGSNKIYDASDEMEKPKNLSEIQLSKKLLKSRVQMDKENKKLFRDLITNEKNKERVDIHSNQAGQSKSTPEQIDDKSRDIDDTLFDELTNLDSHAKQKKPEIHRKIRKVKTASEKNVQFIVCRECGKKEVSNEAISYKSLPRFSIPNSMEHFKINFQSLGLNQRVEDNLLKVDHAISIDLDKKQNVDMLTSKADVLEDEMLESASQVSGPRGPISQYEAQTQRSLNSNIDKDQNMSSCSGGGVLAWIMAGQTQNSSMPTDSNIVRETEKLIDTKSSLVKSTENAWKLQDDSDSA